MFGKPVKSRWILIVCLTIAGLMLAGCEEEQADDTTSVNDSGTPVPPGSPSLPAPGPVTAGTFPANPDLLELDAGANDNTAGTASSIGIGVSQDRSLFPANDVDYAAVSLTFGVTYEFSANTLSTGGDTVMTLFDTDGTTDITPFNDVDGGGVWDYDDFIGLDSKIRFIAPSTATYFVKVTAFDPSLPATYALSTRIISGATDNDGDGYSTLYDCNDSNATIFPWAVELQGDATDFDCDGQLTPADDGTTAGDGFEPDGASGTAKSMNIATGEIYELHLRPEIYRGFAGGGDMRKIYSAAGDDDWVQVVVPPFTQYKSGVSYHFLAWGIIGTLYDNTVTQIGIDNASGFANLTLTNTTAGAKTFFLEFKGQPGETGTYLPYIVNMGTDVDGDGYYTKGGGLGWDCDDGAATIFPGAAGEVVNDDIDTNCNGIDNA